jgi:predicted ATPase
VDAAPERRARVGEPIPLPPLLTLVGSIPMVGRVGPWRALQDAWTKATSGARQVILMPGDAGAGKTRLVTEFARHVHHDGAAVLYGTCSEEQTVPYQPFAEAVDHVASLDPVTVSRYFGTGAAELARLVPRRAAGLGLPVPVRRGDPDGERARLFGAVISLITELADEQPLLLVLDDLHWARRPTIDLLGELAHDQTLRNVLIVGSYRSAPADTGEALRAALPELRRSPGVTRVRLGGFDTEEIADFVEAAAGHHGGRDLEAAVDLLARETDGNPCLLVELWLHLIDTGRLARRNNRWTVVRPLTDAVGRIASRLPPELRELFLTKGRVAVALDGRAELGSDPAADAEHQPGTP